MAKGSRGMRHSLPFHNIHIYPIVQFVAFWNGKDSLGRTLVWDLPLMLEHHRSKDKACEPADCPRCRALTLPHISERK